MKKTFLIIAVVVLLVPGIKSQNFKSRYLLSFSSDVFGTDIGSGLGNASYSWYDTEKNHTFSAININPRAGYFLTNYFVAGLDAVFAFSSQEYTTKSSVLSYGLGPFLRFYTSPSKKVSPFLETSCTLLNVEYKNHSYGNGKISRNYLNLFGGLGISYFITENLAFEALGGYAYLIRADKTSGETYYNLNSLALKAGITIILGKVPKSSPAS